MYFKWAVAEDIGSDPLLHPLRQLFCPCSEERIVDIHTGMADIAHESDVSGNRYLEG